MNRTLADEVKILVAATDVEDARMVADLLTQDFVQVTISTVAESAAEDFESFRPQVLVLAFNSLAEAERYYLGLYRLSSEVHVIPHRTIVLCERTESYHAFELCRKQYFDDYVVFWPVNYDAQRLRMAAFLAAGAATLPGRSGPSPAAFAAQARRIVELEVALQEILSRGDEHLGQVSQSLRDAEARVDQALEGFSRRMAEGGHDDVVEVKDRDGFERAFRHLRELDVQAPFARVNEAMEPVRQWAGNIRGELAPQLESARMLAEMADHVRPLVLVVDDDEFQHRLLQQMLAEAKIDMAFAGSGTEALARLRTHRPDLILLDFQLPDVTGVEVLRRLKLAPATADIPVILITGTSTKEIAMQALQAGAVDFMVKPFDRARLLAGIRRHLQA